MKRSKNRSGNEVGTKRNERHAKRRDNSSGNRKKAGTSSKKIILRRRPCPIRRNDLPEATKLEKELLMHGTTKDKIDVLTLLVEKNPSPENFKSLLAFCENQRNDVHYYVLKNIKDVLVSKKGVDNPYIKQRIIKSFGMNLRNQYIKKKVVRLVYKLLEENVLFMDLIHLFVNKLGDKKDMSEYVVDKLHLLIPGNEEVILDGVEDFYFKNDLFRSRHTVLGFLAKLNCINKKKAFELFDTILNDFNEEIPEEHRNILLEHIIVGLGKNITSEKINRMDLIRRATHTERMVFYGSKVLFGSLDPEILGFFRNAILSHMMRNSRRLPEFLNMVHESASRCRNGEFYRFLLDSSFLYTPQYIVSALIICSEGRKFGLKDLDGVYSLRILALHHHDVVRKLAYRLINNEVIHRFDPFDGMSLINEEMMCADL